jgi:hypothetical protein
VSRNIARTVFIDILIPIAAYLALVRLGMPPASALAASAGVSVLVLGLGWMRTRVLSTLGLLVLVRFLLGIVIAVVTGDARFVLVKDYLVTLLIAFVAAATLTLERPFIARVRRDLSPDPVRFDQQWADNDEFRSIHRQLTKVWVVGLVAEVVVAVAVIYTAPLTAAIIFTNVLTPAVLLALIAVTQTRASRAERDSKAIGGGALRSPASHELREATRKRGG